MGHRTYKRCLRPKFFAVVREAGSEQSKPGCLKPVAAIQRLMYVYDTKGGTIAALTRGWRRRGIGRVSNPACATFSVTSFKTL